MNKKLALEKTHDFCASGKPRLAVVMIHGIASDSSAFARALDYLEEKESLKDVRFITFDLLGSGKSLKDDSLNYDYTDQLGALHNAIGGLKLDVPLVLVGHSMGTFIVTRYADTYKKSVRKLILISAPVYTEKDLESPEMKTAIKAFGDAVSVKNREILQEKAFVDSIDKIVLDKKNYKTLAGLKTPAVLIHGELDQIIAAFNYPKLLAENPKYLTAIKTPGRHGVSSDKYTKMVGVLEEVLDA